jgi:hypothetical protein
MAMILHIVLVVRLLFGNNDWPDVSVIYDPQEFYDSESITFPIAAC